MTLHHIVGWLISSCQRAAAGASLIALTVLLAQSAFAARPAADSGRAVKADRGASTLDIARGASDSAKLSESDKSSPSTVKPEATILKSPPPVTKSTPSPAISTPPSKLSGANRVIGEQKATSPSLPKLSDAPKTIVEKKDTSTGAVKLNDAPKTIVEKKDTSTGAVKLSDAPKTTIEKKDTSTGATKIGDSAKIVGEKKDVTTKTLDTQKDSGAKVVSGKTAKTDAAIKSKTGVTDQTEADRLRKSALDAKTIPPSSRTGDKSTTDIIGRKPGDKSTTDIIGKKPGDKSTDFTGKKLAKDTDALSLPKSSLTGKSATDARKLDIKDVSSVRFEDRYKSGQLEHVTKGDVAQKIRLNDQYKLHEQGDIARRLDLEKNVNKTVNITNINVKNTTIVNQVFGPDYHYYYGRVHPLYAQSCFRISYWGPGFFAGICWYPRWNPWVDWSWNHHVHVIYDPRPIWCRPIYYYPSPVWVWWEVPVWRPLPVVTAGTWVDVKPVVLVEPTQYDLQLLAVRFVDPGHPEEKLGPRYRVWFRNNSTLPITKPFNVMLFAGNGERLSAELPQAGARVTSIEAGDTQSVDIRLPFESLAMGRDPAGNPVPFGTLHVLVDANREVPLITRIDNGAHIDRAEVLPVDPATFAADPREVDAGGELILAGEGYGPQPGQVLVNLGGLEMEGEILGWYDLGVRVMLPKLPLAAPTAADVIVVRGDGAAANPLKIVVTP
jgi:hypothetical protein